MPKKKEELLAAGDVIRETCEKYGYSRPHVANMLRTNAKSLRAVLRGGRWMIPRASVKELNRLVIEGSGPRYKLGETGANRRRAA